MRLSKACDLRWDNIIDLPNRTIIVRRLKGSTDSVRYLERDEMNGLKLHRQQQSDGIKAAHVFINERGQPFGRMGNARMIDWADEGALAAREWIRGGFLGHASITNTVR